VAVIHSFYSSALPSGENVVVDAQVGALRQAGHDVLLVAQHTDERATRATYRIEAAVTVATGRGPSPEDDLRAFRPDVVHVHNLFPNFGTRWLESWPGPVVATLHNFRPMCASAILFRDGHLCTECPDGNRWASLRHGCYRGSRVATLPVAWRNRGGVQHDPVVRRADALVALSARARAVYRSAGLDEARLRVIPNFVQDPFATRPDGRPNGRWLFVGRLTPEKGILDLIRRWPSREGLDVVGEGPLWKAATSEAPDTVTFLGAVPNAVLRTLMPHYRGLVVASKWFEGLPTVYLEALAAGLPVVSFAGNSVADDVSAHGPGIVIDRGSGRDELLAALTSVQDGGSDLRNRSRACFISRFTAGRWISEISTLYATVAAGHETVDAVTADRVGATATIRKPSGVRRYRRILGSTRSE
jgi:glycosyltransferase involved in cell wall biosynthesis